MAYGGYDGIAIDCQGQLRLVACGAHMRRRFYAQRLNAPTIATPALAWFRRLYLLERQWKPLTDEERYKQRQAEALPILKEFHTWLKATQPTLLPKSKIGEAVSYALNQWESFVRYCDAGFLSIDNNQSEQIIRPLTVGRGNWMFLGHPLAAPGRLKLYSIVSSAHRHHLVIQDYLEDVLARLADAQQNHPADLKLGSDYLAELLPDRWAAAHPQSVRQERVEEKEAVSDAKRARRAEARVAARAKQAVTAV